MEKIGIITLNGYKNYGNRLQNYALQEAIKSFGYDVDTILIDNEAIVKSRNNSSKAMSIFNNSKRVIRKLYSIKNQKYNKLRTEKFKDFSKEFINETHFKISENKQSIDNLHQYKYFVTGSDQVWNPYYINGSPLYFLSFAPREKRISYAASFGISSIPVDYQAEYKQYLNEMQFISVREKQGAKIVKDLTGREAEVLVDPTMLLTKEEWMSIAKKSDKKPAVPYLLTYFLGELEKDTESKINKLAKERNLQIINLANMKDRDYYTADPSEFIDFINSAEIFCTDSFHGVVFSILLETPFIIFERQGRLPSMNSRIETIISKFDFHSRMAINIDSSNNALNIDFSHVNRIITEERKKAYSYLKNTLK